MEEQGRRGTVAELACRSRRQGEPRSGRSGEAAAGRRRLRRAHLRPSEHHAVRHHEEQERQLREAVLASTSAAANVTIPEDVTKVNLTDYRGAERLPDLHVHLDPRLQGAELRQPPQGEGRGDDEAALVDHA